MQPVISLVSIVKNEETILEKMIGSVKNIVDEFVVVDTGSTDRTKEIIAKYGEVRELPFVNFVETKNEALKFATGKYILFMDADERMYAGASVLKEWASGGNVGAINCRITEGPPNNDNFVTCQYNRIRMWRNDGSWKFAGPGVHEAIVGSGNVVLDGRVLVRHEHEGKSRESVSPEKYEFWAHLLKQALEKDENDARALFYLARTYKDLNRKLDAISYYKRYLEVPENNYRDERWQACYDSALIYKSLGECELAMEMCNKANEIDPRRAEQWNLRGWIYFQQQDYENAILNYEEADKRVIPSDVVLFLNPREYGFLPKDQLTLCYYRTEQFDKAEKKCKELAEITNPKDKRILNNWWWCKTRTNSTIFMTLGNTPEPIWGGMIETHGVHGLETTYLELSEEFAKQGHNVFLFCNTKEEHIYKEVNYIPWEKISEYSLNPDIVITSRWFDSLTIFSNARKILWLQDANPLEANYDFGKIDKVVCSSKWHRDYLIELAGHKIPKGKIEVIPLGIRKGLFNGGGGKEPHKVIYSSNPDRGLQHLADMWPRLLENIPELKLTVLYGWNGLLTWNQSEEWKNSVEGRRQIVLEKLSGYGTRFLGRVTKREVAKEMLSSSLMLYPCNFYETFCLTALESQAAGTPIITTGIGALNTTVNSKANVLLQGSPTNDNYQREYIDAVSNLFRDQNKIELMSVYNKDYISKLKCDWVDIARMWQDSLWRLMK